MYGRIHLPLMDGPSVKCVIKKINFFHLKSLKLGEVLVHIGPDRLESIIYDITEKKIDNPHSRLLLCFSL